VTNKQTDKHINR